MNFLAVIGRVFLAFLASTGRLTNFTLSALLHCMRAPIYWRLIGQQMMRVGYFSLPVVGLTAFFTGRRLALQIFDGGNRYRRRIHRAEHRRARHHPRIGAGDRRPDGCRPGRRRDRRGNRHDARHRTDRRADHPVHQSDEISRGAAPGRCRGLACRSWCWSPTRSACSAAIWSRPRASGSTAPIYFKNTVDFVTHGDVNPALSRRRSSASSSR